MKTTTSPNKQFLTYSEVGELMGVCKRTVQRLVRRGAIRQITFSGRLKRIPAAELERLRAIAA
jgi:excisionase family DNA binding protein